MTAIRPGDPWITVGPPLADHGRSGDSARYVPGTLPSPPAEWDADRSRRNGGRGNTLRLPRMSTFVLRLIAPRPTFATDMSDEERAIMGRHAAHWQPYLASGQMVVF